METGKLLRGLKLRCDLVATGMYGTRSGTRGHTTTQEVDISESREEYRAISGTRDLGLSLNTWGLDRVKTLYLRDIDDEGMFFLSTALKIGFVFRNFTETLYLTHNSFGNEGMISFCGAI